MSIKSGWTNRMLYFLFRIWCYTPQPLHGSLYKLFAPQAFRVLNLSHDFLLQSKICFMICENVERRMELDTVRIERLLRCFLIKISHVTQFLRREWLRVTSNQDIKVFPCNKLPAHEKNNNLLELNRTLNITATILHALWKLANLILAIRFSWCKFFHSWERRVENEQCLLRSLPKPW